MISQKRKNKPSPNRLREEPKDENSFRMCGLQTHNPGTEDKKSKWQQRSSKGGTIAGPRSSTMIGRYLHALHGALWDHPSRILQTLEYVSRGERTCTWAQCSMFWTDVPA